MNQPNDTSRQQEQSPSRKSCLLALFAPASGALLGFVLAFILDLNGLHEGPPNSSTVNLPAGESGIPGQLTVEKSAATTFCVLTSLGACAGVLGLAVFLSWRDKFRQAGRD